MRTGAAARRPASGGLAPRHQQRSINRSDVGGLVAQVRRPAEGKLNLPATLRGLGVRMSRRALPDTLWGLTVGLDAIVVNARLGERDRVFAAAHEIAHVLVRRGDCRVWGRADEEAFANAFANELLS
jgi:hypothetical protein